MLTAESAWREGKQAVDESMDARMAYSASCARLTVLRATYDAVAYLRFFVPESEPAIESNRYACSEVSIHHRASACLS